VAPEELSVAAGLPAPVETTAPPARTSPSPTASRPGASPSGTASPAGRAVSATGLGGSVVVRCRGGVPVFVSRIPRQGYSVENDSPGEVRFRSDDHRTDVKVSCAGTEPQVRVEEEDDSSGPGGGDDDDSGPGGDDD
jgi:hypothetical protein